MTTIDVGALSLTLDDNGAFAREIRVAGEEMFRGIGLVVRDAHWGTPPLAGTLAIERGETSIVAKGQGSLRLEEAVLDWQTEWTVSATGIVARATFSSPTGLDTNRTGFVVLHSLGASRRRPLRVMHPDGTVTQTVFPDLVSPHQPFLDVAAMDYVTAAGHSLRLSFEGEVFETEDQRNWTDASYKTYCRPLARPFPYRIDRDVLQILRLDIAPGHPAEAGRPHSAKTTRMPLLGTGLPPGPAPAGLADALNRLGGGFTAIEIDLADADWAAQTLARCEAATGPLRLDLRPHEQQSAALETLAPLLRERTLIGVSLWGAQDETLAEARKLLTGVPMGGGTGAFFTELNRMTPVPAGADYLCWTSNPTVHGFNDDTIGESIEPLDDILRTAKRKHPGQHFQLGPMTLGMRFNPNATTEEGRGRAADPDPRQGDIIAAAWLACTLAGYADDTVSTVAFFDAIGPKGFFAADGTATPAAHLFARLAALSGREMDVLAWAAAPRARGMLMGNVLCIGHARHGAARLELPDGMWRASSLTPAGFGAARPVESLELDGFAVSWLTRHLPELG
jgi:D-apionolactonase